MSENGNEHRKFLKSRTYKLFKEGDYLNDELIINKKQDVLDLSVYKHEVDNGTVIFVMTTHCSACNFDSMTDYMNKYNKFNYLLLIETDHKFISELVCRVSNDKLSVISAEIDVICKQLKFDVVPWVFALNKKGQFVAGREFNSIKEAEFITKPLLRVYYNEIWRNEINAQ
jgi:hypothetical protein